MIKIEKTMIRGRFNLVDPSIESGDDAHYIRQLDLEEVRELGASIANLITE
jgi:hypothetical protein